MAPFPLRQRLDELGVTSILAAFRSHSPTYGPLRDGLDALDERVRAVVDALCFSAEIDAAMAWDCVPELAERLTASGIATQVDGRFRLPSARLVEHHGSLLIVGPHGEHTNGYYGADSVGLGSQLLAARGRCLDLFASTGAQSTLMADRGTSVLAVEIDRSLEDVFAINLELNDCTDRVEVRWGDATTIDLEGPYDTVAMNAPLLPSFGISGLAVGADGGTSGHDLMSDVLARVELRPGGRIHSTATIVGDASGPDVAWLQAHATRSSLGFVVVPTGVGTLRAGAFGSMLAETLAGASGRARAEVELELDEGWRAAGVTHVYFCLVTGHHAATPSVLVAHSGHGGRGWRF